MEAVTLTVILTVVLALFFDFTNGFHDTANAMATPIATGALKPRVAVILAACLNLVGAFLSTEVAKTISGGIIHEDHLTPDAFPAIIFAGLVGAITWNMLTWLLGLPSSSSHALFGGLIGATLVGAGIYAIDFGVLLSKVVLPALVAPLTAGIIAFCATKVAYVVTRRYDGRPDGRSGFRWGQIITSSLVALAHGTNDAQKTMGVITLAFIAVGWQSSAHPEPMVWVVIACALAIALGTYTGGWRIIRTLGKGLTDVKPAQGFSAETSTAATILASSAFGFALSTTQVASGSVIGSGLGRRGSRVRWNTVGRIVVGWLLTLPAAAIVGAISAFFVVWWGLWGVLANAVLATAVVLLVFRLSRRSRVHAHNALDEETAPAGPRPSFSEVATSALAVDVPETPSPTRRQRAILLEKERLRVEAENLQIRAALAAERQERIKVELLALQEAEAREAEATARVAAERRAKEADAERERIEKALRKAEKQAKRGRK